MSGLHALLARLLPAAFRARYRSEMQEVMSARRAELSTDRPGRRAAFWLRETGDLLVTLAREWRRAIARRLGVASPRHGDHQTPDPGAHRSSPNSLPARSVEMLTNLSADLRFVLRTLARQPLFTSLVILTLGFGIGATTAVFTLVDSVLMRPLPYPEPERLVIGYGSFPLNDFASVSPPDYLDYRDRSASFEALAAISSWVGTVAVGGGEAPEIARMRRASAELFAALGVAPAMGRTFRRDETVAGGARVAVISDGFWRRRFGADPGVVGGDIVLDEERATLIGVLPAGFELLDPTDVWLPLAFGDDDMTVRRFHFLRALGRLRDGVVLNAAQDEIDAIAADLAEAYPDSNTDWTMRLVPLHRAVVGGAQQSLLVLLGAVGAVLLIASCNVALLLLARTVRRGPEIALRNALGASGRRIVRLLLTESLVLALAGGGLGLLMTAWGVDLLVNMAAADLPRAENVAVNGSVLGFSILVTLGTGLLFGLAPALRLSRTASLASASQGRRATAGGQRLRGALVIGQVALSFALLLGAGLLIRSFLAMTRADPGYAADEIASASIDLPATRYQNPEQRRQFFDRLFERLASVNSIARAGGIDVIPQTGGNDTYAYPEGSPPEPGTQGYNAQLRVVTPGYFDAMGIPLRRGRMFSAGDVVAGCEREAGCGNTAVIIDEPFAEEIFPGQDAVGRRIVVDLGEPAHVEVVGVVGGVLHWSPSDGRFGTMYFPFGASPRASLHVALRPTQDADAALAALRTVVAEIDPQLPLADVDRMSDRLAVSMSGPRIRARLMGAFAGSALLLAAAGLYGVLACFVTERRRELGVRLALGADAAGVVRLVVRQGMRLVLLGLALGLLAAAGMSRALQGLLFGVTASDPVSFGVVGVILAAVALPACLVPAWRATRVDPIEVMRAE